MVYDGIEDAFRLKKDFFDALHNPNKVNAVLVSDDDVKVYEKDGDAILAIRVPKAPREEKPVYMTLNSVKNIKNKLE